MQRIFYLFLLCGGVACAEAAARSLSQEDLESAAAQQPDDEGCSVAEYGYDGYGDYSGYGGTGSYGDYGGGYGDYGGDGDGDGDGDPIGDGDGDYEGSCDEERPGTTRLSTSHSVSATYTSDWLCDMWGQPGQNVTWDLGIMLEDSDEQDSGDCSMSETWLRRGFARQNFCGTFQGFAADASGSSTVIECKRCADSHPWCAGEVFQSGDVSGNLENTPIGEKNRINLAQLMASMDHGVEVIDFDAPNPFGEGMIQIEANKVLQQLGSALGGIELEVEYEFGVRGGVGAEFARRTGDTDGCINEIPETECTVVKGQVGPTARGTGSVVFPINVDVRTADLGLGDILGDYAVSFSGEIRASYKVKFDASIQMARRLDCPVGGRPNGWNFRGRGTVAADLSLRMGVSGHIGNTPINWDTTMARLRCSAGGAISRDGPEWDLNCRAF